MENKILANINMNDLREHLQILAGDAYSKKLIYGTSLKKYNSLIDSKKKVRKSTLEKEIEKLSDLLTKSKPRKLNINLRKIIF